MLKVDIDKVRHFITALNSFKSMYQVSIQKEKELSASVTEYNAHGKGNISISGLEHAMDYPNKVIDDFVSFLNNTVQNVSGTEDEVLKMARELMGDSMIDEEGYVKDNDALWNLLKTEGGATDEYSAMDGGTIKDWSSSAFADGKFKLVQEETTGSYRIEKYDENGNLIGYTGFVNEQIAENFMNQSVSSESTGQEIRLIDEKDEDLASKVQEKVNNLEEFTLDGKHIFYLNDGKGSRIYNSEGITFSWDANSNQYVGSNGVTLTLDQLKHGTIVGGQMQTFENEWKAVEQEDVPSGKQINSMVSGVGTGKSLAIDINRKINNLENFTIDGNHIFLLKDGRKIYSPEGMTFSWDENKNQYFGTNGVALTLDQLKNGTFVGGQMETFENEWNPSENNSPKDSKTAEIDKLREEVQKSVSFNIANHEDFYLNPQEVLSFGNGNVYYNANGAIFSWDENSRSYKTNHGESFSIDEILHSDNHSGWLMDGKIGNNDRAYISDKEHPRIIMNDKHVLCLKDGRKIYSEEGTILEWDENSKQYMDRKGNAYSAAAIKESNLIAIDENGYLDEEESNNVDLENFLESQGLDGDEKVKVVDVKK